MDVGEALTCYAVISLLHPSSEQSATHAAQTGAIPKLGSGTGEGCRPRDNINSIGYVDQARLKPGLAFMEQPLGQSRPVGTSRVQPLA